MGRRGFVVLASAAALVLLLALPAASPAHQRVAVKNGELVISGDFFKETDEVTITYDSANDRFVITHDIEAFEEEGEEECERDKVEPVHVVYCSAKGIKRIRVIAGNEADKVDVSGLYAIAPGLGFAVFLPKQLTSVSIDTGSGNDKVEVGPPVSCTDCSGTSPATIEINTGTGIDDCTLNGATNNVVSAGSAKLTVNGGVNAVQIATGGSALTLVGGVNAVTVGDGNSKAAVSGGENTVTFGAGNSAYTATGGTNTVTFGAGNGVFSGGPLTDVAVFGVGNNSFRGGAGEDTASLGPGRDEASGGPAHDILRGGPGRDTLRGSTGKDDLFGEQANDKLFGGPALDRLNGGPGGADECYGGPAHAILRFCERP